MTMAASVGSVKSRQLGLSLDPESSLSARACESGRGRLADLAPWLWETTVLQILGALHEKLRMIKNPGCTILLAGAYLDRVGTHSPRVWPSEEFVQKWIEERTPAETGGFSIRSLQRGRAILRKWIRTIKDPAEIAAGPGPHEYPQDLHVGDGVVPVLDVSGLLGLLPETFLELLPLWFLKQIPGIRLPESIAIATLHGVSPERQSLGERLPEPDPPPPPMYVSIEGTSDQTQRGTGGAEGADFTVPKSAHINSTADGAESGENQAGLMIGNGAGEVASAGRPDARSAGDGRSQGPLSPARTPDEETVEWLLSVVPRLRPSNARRWVRDMGTKWCRELVAYVRYEDRQGKVRNFGAYANGTYVNYFDEKKAGKRIQWPDDFLIELTRERAKASREMVPTVPAASLAQSTRGGGEFGLTADQAERVRRLSEIEKPAALVDVWRKFLIIGAHKLPKPTFLSFVMGDSLMPIAWDPVKFEATLLASTQLGRKTLASRFDTALGDILQEALNLPVTQTVRVRIVDELPEGGMRSARPP